MITSNKQFNSIDLIEDCLNQIYWARKSNLLARSKRFKEKQEHQNIHGETNEIDLSASRTVPLLGKEEFSKIPAPHKSELLDSNVNVPLQETTFAVPISKVKYLSTKKSYLSGQTTSHDTAAEKLYDDFIDEISKWLKNNSTGAKDEDLRGEYADFLVDKYLSRKLDVFERSDIVAEVRKRLANDIEEFASSGTIPNATSNKSLKPEAVSAEFSIPKLLEEKRSQQQKEKVKSHYEAFQNTKKRVDFHPDVKTLQEYTDLNDEIKSLIDSLQTTKPLN